MCNCSYHNCPVGFIDPVVQVNSIEYILLILLISIAISLIIKLSYDYYKEKRSE